jgi:hypothetical protein
VVLTNSQKRERLRPHGVTGGTCRDCYFLKQCGGFQGEASLYDCFVATCCEYQGRDKAKCNAVCPRHPDFYKWMSQLGGRPFDYIPALTQRYVPLPAYVPLIDHGYRRRRALQTPVIALDTYRVMRLRRGDGRLYNAISASAAGLRSEFGLAPEATVILRGTAKDPCLERWWEHRLADDAPGQLSQLGIAMIIAPNFSHFLDVPRLDNLFNRVRQMICIEELAAAGHCVVPHISTTSPGDWQYWADFLKKNSTVRQIAKEFQTGYRSARQGQEAVHRLARLQDDANRALEPIVIGGTQFVKALARRFDKFSLVDSMPFAKAVYRRRFDGSAGRHSWRESFTFLGQGIEEVLEENIRGYGDMLLAAIAEARANASKN